MRLAILLLLTCGCRQIFGIDEPRLLDAAIPTGDGHADAIASDAPSLCFSRPELSFAACVDHAPTTAFSVTAPVAFDTDTNVPPVCAPLISESQDMCVVVATDVTVSATVTVTGSRPIVIFATGTIAIDAMFDVASHAMTAFNQPTRGPGENPSVCGIAGDGTMNGGGAGGSFTTSGGLGGRGGQANATGGDPAAPFTVQTFHGGCRGGVGGDGVGNAAFGGGALALVANIVSVGNTIDASGAAGAGAIAGARGGYGGGAGGMVLIDAPTVNLGASAQIFANGGAGGGGSSLSQPGIVGSEASSYNGNIQGGPGGNTGGNGGNAFPQTQSGQQANGANAGGGGGGGGGGAVVIYSGMPQAGKISPALLSHPY